MEKIKKEIEEKEKKENEEANKLRQDFKKEEKAKEKEISKKNEQILLKYKPYMSQKLETKKYLYNERYDKYFLYSLFFYRIFRNDNPQFFL